MIWAKTKAGDMKIADVRGWGHLIGTGALNLPEAEAIAIQDANGNLLCAAPELLALAREAYRIHTCSCSRCEDPCIRCQAEAAIAKAEGRS